ncbi:hypothetical protein SARC_01900 [Sphaeroforma arctica JP610]|uniref:Galactose oxidase n=1 Tax=Sphaeroforma arctica JP610 TaxID=667725 RepID=A0A0L0GAM0_9EUKA|nr:hypothetical protein SARC_01900 [Sphaeroforma arctica JP610]KNC85954.1 hypothetical protein SARC_01900 [Sphaeroforma arctica JP610]|eukprot:XP_014159856.1 hypothetical protein SARC_01900 [Sphaeroforma arctica JP610]
MFTRQGGAGYQHGSFFNDVWCSVILNGETPVTAMDWQRKGPKEGLADSIPQITSHHSAVEYNGGMYVYGGITVNADLPTGGERVDTSSLWRFDLANDTWSKFPSVTSASPPPRHSHTAVVHEDRMYVYGGSDLKKVHFNDMWTFDFNTQVWENITTDAFPSARSWHGAGVAEGDMYVFGGGQCEKSCKLHNELWKYTFSSQTWTQLDVGSAPLGRYKHTFTVMEQRGGEGGVNIILTGGESYRCGDVQM